MPTAHEIRAELDVDERALGYAPLVAGGAVGALEALLGARIYRGPVPIIDVAAYCATQGITGAVEATAHEPSAPIEVRALCFSVLSILREDLRLNNADLDDPAFEAMTGGLIGAGLLTAEQRDQIKALGDARRNRAEVLWGVSVRGEQIAEALGLG